MGDFVLTLPVFQCLRRAAPNANVEVLGNPRIASLAVAFGLARTVTSIDSPGLESFFVAGAELSGAGAEFFAQFDLIISYLFDPHSIFAGNVRSVSGARFVAGCCRPADGVKRHASAQLLDPVISLGIRGDGIEPRYRIEGEDLEKKEDVRFLAVHPGSGSPRKNWRIEAWVEFLIRVLRTNRELGLTIVGGEADGEQIERLRSELPAERVSVCVEQPLVDVAILLRRSTFFMGHDSGISHLAAAVGCRGLVLWGPSDAETWRPRSSRFDILNAGDDLESLSVDKVYGAYARSTGM